MIFCGTDIIEIERIKKSIDDFGEAFLNKVFTKKEIEYCESKKQMKYQHYAVRFSAKEAIFKALSKQLPNKFELGWKNVQIENDNDGRPQVKFIDYELKKLEQIDLSLSHCEKYAVATAIVIIGNGLPSARINNK